MRSKYERGRTFEYEVRDLLRKQGFYVFRCAGSKPIDLIAIYEGQPLLIECKTDKSKIREDLIKHIKLAEDTRVPLAYFVKTEEGAITYTIMTECSETLRSKLDEVAVEVGIREI
jgi:Holliday junction resolvase